MITFILPGYSPKNKDWANKVAGALDLSHEIRPVEWEHWEDKTEYFHPDEKARKLMNIVLKNKINIIAKSVGVFVALHFFDQVPNQINKAILCGTNIEPCKSDKKELFETAVKKVDPSKLVFLQNANDPLGSFTETEKLVHTVSSKIKVVKMPRDDHDYPYFQDFQKCLTE